MKIPYYLKFFTFKFFITVFYFLPFFKRRIKKSSYKGNTAPISIAVIDTLTMSHLTFNSINKAARFFNSYQKAITRSLLMKQLFQKRYFIISKLEFNLISFIFKSFIFIFYFTFLSLIILILYLIIFVLLSNFEEEFYNFYEFICTYTQSFLHNLEEFLRTGFSDKPENNQGLINNQTQNINFKYQIQDIQNQISFSLRHKHNTSFNKITPYSFNEFYFINNSKKHYSILNLANPNFNSILFKVNLDFHSFPNYQNILTNRSPITPITPISELLNLYTEHNYTNL